MLVPVRGNSNLKRQRGVELLVLAAQQGQTDWVRRLLDAGVNPDTSGYSNPNFMDALGAALVFGHSDTAYLLIERGAPLNRSCSTPPEWLDEKFRKAGNRRAGGYPTNYPIHFAVMRRDLDALRLLILNRVDPNKLNSNKMTPLALASYDGWLEGVELLIEAGASRMIDDLDGNSPRDHAAQHPKVREALMRNRFGLARGQEAPPGIALCLAIDANDAARVRELVKMPEVANSFDQYGLKPFHYAASWNRPEMFAPFIEAGYSPDVPDTKGRTALFFALNNNSEAAALRLLELGASVAETWSDGKGPTLLEMAVSRKYFDLAMRLVDKGANPQGSVPDSGFAESPLCWAADEGHLPMVKRLLEAGADPKQPDSQGFHALFHACMANNPEVVRLLVERGLDVNSVAPDGQTPLSIAVRKSNVAIVRELLALGAQPDPLKRAVGWGNLALSDTGREIMALLEAAHGKVYQVQGFWAANPGRKEIMDYITKGGDSNPRDMADPLGDAIRNGDYELAHFLLAHGTDPNGQIHRHQSPLYFLAAAGTRKSETEIVVLAKALLDRGADIEIGNMQGGVGGPGDTPLMMAVSSGHVELAEFLIAAGAKLDGVEEELAQAKAKMDPKIYTRMKLLIDGKRAGNVQL